MLYVAHIIKPVSAFLGTVNDFSLRQTEMRYGAILVFTRCERQGTTAYSQTMLSPPLQLERTILPHLVGEVLVQKCAYVVGGCYQAEIKRNKKRQDGAHLLRWNRY